MIRIYTSLDSCEKSGMIYDNDGFFNNRICGRDLSDLSLEKMMRLDRAKLIDINLGTIETPFGICNLKNLSTGCKTVVNLIYLIEHKDEFSNIKAINATECGANALDELFDVLEITDYDIGIVLRHKNNLEQCKEREYLIDDTRKINSLLWM